MSTYITRAPEAPSNLKTEAEAREQLCMVTDSISLRCQASTCGHWLWVEGEGVEWERKRSDGRGRFSLAESKYVLSTDLPDGWELDPAGGPWPVSPTPSGDGSEGPVYYFVRRPVKVHPQRGICGLVHRVIQLERAP